MAKMLETRSAITFDPGAGRMKGGGGSGGNMQDALKMMKKKKKKYQGNTGQAPSDTAAWRGGGTGSM